MAKRRTKLQLNADRIIKAELLTIGQKIIDEAVPYSRRDTGSLQDEMNYEVKPDTTLKLYQMIYGAFNFPVGVESGEKNALWIVTKKFIPEATKAIIGNINKYLLKNGINNDNELQ